MWLFLGAWIGGAIIFLGGTLLNFLANRLNQPPIVTLSTIGVLLVLTLLVAAIGAALLYQYGKKRYYKAAGYGQGTL
jgi:nitrate reductase gamma subunit